MARVSQFRPRASFSRGLRRKSSWLEGPRGSILAIATSSVNLHLTGVQATLDGLTSVRLRGEYMAQLSSATAQGDGFRVVLGIGIASDNAFSVGGVNSLPDPIVDIAWDGWLYHVQFNLKASSTTITNEEGATMVRHVVDSKAMRKFKSSDVMFGVTSVQENVSAILDVHLETRLLVKLP